MRQCKNERAVSTSSKSETARGARAACHDAGAGGGENEKAPLENIFSPKANNVTNFPLTLLRMRVYRRK
jgi:hypothetical protein